ncbi:sterol desaturase family protein [Dinghuibacter silviterrae]|uniref:Sterol desaturase/sphingolipid hydroxylase (Fatty acid hydroxylase superfamily) n=1 Tax=Dinghuibacter silviterrae TaxID=1539049 RepID=A0A4R8DSB3_9BACT|nr:sterol desaturase family protein [Dinghuibacter silviterrae]TDX00746.1 sterol desaturase/sphingolipid hydroxylase (fatty acid hydroxylase superfamily) [Dinghuibacter silviterrae]
MGSLREQWLILLSTPIYFIVIGLEILLTHAQQRRAYTLKDTITNFYLMIANASIDLAFRGVYVWILQYFYNHRVLTLQESVLYWVGLLIAEDFMYYWLHRIDHFCRFFWAVHVTHHSSSHFNFTVGFRSSVFEPLYRFIFFIPLAWLGFSPLNIAFMYSATQIWGILVHTEKIGRLGWLEYIFVTPSHHKVHHASNPKYLDKNLGMFLIVWDKLFGTFQPEDDHYQPVRFGLTKELENQGPVNIIFHEWQAIVKDLRVKGTNWKQKLSYIFGPPGWSHDGSRQTSKQLREEEDAMHTARG